VTINQPFTENELITQLALGSEAAFSAVYDQFYPLIFYYVKRRVNNPDTANDITAECFIKFWKGGKKNFDSLEGIRAYLLRAAANASINAIRNQNTEIAHQKELMHQLSDAEEIIVSEEDEYRAALMKLVLAEIEKLPRQCRQIFTMAYFQEMKNEEIAQELQISNKTVRNQKTRALQQLRLALLEKKIQISVVFILLFNKEL
jgi:RNA polymerase sigma-70 factor (family 1)